MSSNIYPAIYKYIAAANRQNYGGNINYQNPKSLSILDYL
jgi:hypothetical protein